jgi:hypothetical protein
MGAGALIGVLAQLRPVSLALAPVFALSIATTTPARTRRRLAHAGAVTLACLLALAPWTLRGLAVRGRLAPLATAGTQAAPVSPAEVDRRGLAGSLAAKAWDEPVALLSWTATEFLHFWELYPQRIATDNPVLRATLHAHDERLPLAPLAAPRVRDTVSMLSFGLELPLALVGAVHAFRRRPAAAWLLAGVILAYAFGYALFVAKLRYRIPVLPHLFVFTAVGACAAATALTARRRDRRRLVAAMSPP